MVGHEAGSPLLYLASSTPEPRNAKLARDCAVRLEECREMLLESGRTETVQLLDIVLLQLRMQLNDVSEAELKALCASLADGRDSLGVALRDG